MASWYLKGIFGMKALQGKTLATQAALVQTRIRLDGYNANITKGTMDQGYNSFKKIG